MTATVARPTAEEHARYYARYVELVPGNDVLAALASEGEAAIALLRGIGEDRGGLRYVTGKWSVREVVGHVVHMESVFASRAQQIARGEALSPLELPPQDSDRRTLADLTAEWGRVRGESLTIFGALSPEDWTRSGVGQSGPISVRALAWIIVGHGMHHTNILRERYLS